MESHKQTDKPTSIRQRNRRPTIGYLALSISEDLSQARWCGVADTAWKQGANLICFRGGPLHDPIGLYRQTTPLYDLLSPEIVDGWVVGNVVADSPASFAKFRDFCDQQSGLPMVSIRESLCEIPYIPLDNYQGVREAMVHLVEVHGYRRIAFLCGPEAHPYAQERYRAYTDVLKEYGLPFDPNLVTPPRDWNEPAIQVLLGERKLRPLVDFEAIVAANDWMALDALRKLQAQSVRIPGDVAIVGFNNNPEGRGIAPPLTSVAVPFYEQGQRALEMLLALLAGERVPEQATLPAKLVVRQSCGCTSEAVRQAAVGTVAMAQESLGAVLTARRAELIAEVGEALGQVEGQTAEWVGQLLDGFAAEVQGKTSGAFVQELNDILRQVYLVDGDVAVWHQVVSTLRRRVMPYVDSSVWLRAEDLWQQARVLIGNMAQHAETRLAWQARHQAQTLREISQALITTFDMGELMNVLADRLPRLDIPSCYLCLYEDPHEPTGWSRLMLAYNEQGRIKLEPEGRRFPSRRLIPEGIFSQERQYSFVVEALYFQEHQLGFVLFEAGPRDGKIYETLRDQISSALQGALLVQRVRERSAELARQQYILDTFMENVPDRIYFKDLDSRITRANKSHALRMGLSDPVEEIGKSDFDFFPEEQARVKYEQEQEIIRTGQPISLEEESLQPDGQAGWVLTTKMPLRDEHGHILGTFGISRDITELKQAQAALEKAYAEVEQQVQERTAELRHEIAERKRAEEALRESEERYRRLAEAAHDMIFILNREGNVDYVNSFATQQLGRLPEEIIGRSHAELFLSDDAERQQVRLRQVFEAGQPLYVENPTQFPNQRMWLGTWLVPIKDEAGQVKSVLGVSRDITERKRAEEALRESEQRFRTLAEASFEGIALSEGGVFVDLNDQLAHILGYSRSELIGKSVMEVVAPESRDLVADAIRSGRLEPYEHLALRKDGTTFPVEARARATQMVGRPLRVTAIRDITERKRTEEALRKSEARYRAVIESQVDLISRYLPNTILTFVNDAYCQFYGKTREELIGHSFLFMIAPEFRELVRKETENLAKDPRPLAGEYLNYRRDGKECWIQWVVQCIVDENGQVVELQAVGRDITERKQAEAEIRRLNEELEQRVVERTAQLEAANKELEAFSYSVSHDLRAPLRAVDGFSRILLEDYMPQLPPEVARYLRIIFENTQQMRRLIDGLLAFSRLSRQPLNKQPIASADLVRQVLDSLSDEQAGRQVDILIGALPVCRGDPMLLRQVWINLLSNALKFTRRREVARIEIGCVEREGEQVYFVKDNGVGFDMRYADKLFGVFQRLHRVEDYEGTGVGLATVQRIIHRHGGRIWSEAEPDKGATFYFTI